jgi:hypothetical protein
MMSNIWLRFLAQASEDPNSPSLLDRLAELLGMRQPPEWFPEWFPEWLVWVFVGFGFLVAVAKGRK